MTLSIILVAITAIIALYIGLFLRRLLVRRLKNTVLDNWIIQTLGILIILPSLIVAAAVAPFILGDGAINATWGNIVQGVPSHLAQIKDFGLGFIETVLIIVLGIGIARTIMKVTIRGLGESRIDINIRTLIGRIFYIFIVLIGIFWILTIWQVPIYLPVAVISALAIAGAFAIQDILKDLVAGFYILMERPFHIGDEISTATYTGKVEDVQLRATKLRITSGEEATVPNALVFGGIVINNSYYGERRTAITVTLPQDQFVKEETPNRILQALKELDDVMVKPEPAVMISGYSGNLVTLMVYFWIASRQLATVSDVMYTLRTVFPNADLAVHEPASNI